ncbi:NAD(P)/FAD-dependent oxidoreductase [Glycomyces mayteni]|uniref:NAD(P)/FAD-dependent oxidoreductase n=1 Tax=Glycomyces mayteni TaxID=543887 RepID=A0ABW2D7T4_9ACTN
MARVCPGTRPGWTIITARWRRPGWPRRRARRTRCSPRTWRPASPSSEARSPDCPLGLPFPVTGAVRVEGQAQFHPRRFLLAVAADLTARGVRVFERSRVVDVAAEDGGHRVTVEGGAAVRCREAVIATHYPVVNRVRLLSRLTPRRELVVAAPIPAAADPGGMYLTPAEGTRSVRTAPLENGKRLLIVTGEAFTPGEAGTAERFGRLAAWAAERFGSEDIAYRWAAQDNATPDRVPYIGAMPGGGSLRRLRIRRLGHEQRHGRRAPDHRTRHRRAARLDRPVRPLAPPPGEGGRTDRRQPEDRGGAPRRRPPRARPRTLARPARPRPGRGDPH